MEDFNLILHSIIEQNNENIKIPEELKPRFEETAENYIKKDMILEAIKVFILTKNENKLIELGKLSLSKGENYNAFKAFQSIKNIEGLNKVADEFLKQGETNNALVAFKGADNQEMIKFLEENF
jgi:hypothetical protein